MKRLTNTGLLVIALLFVAHTSVMAAEKETKQEKEETKKEEPKSSSDTAKGFSSKTFEDLKNSNAGQDNGQGAPSSSKEYDNAKPR